MFSQTERGNGMWDVQSIHKTVTKRPEKPEQCLSHTTGSDRSDKEEGQQLWMNPSLFHNYWMKLRRMWEKVKFSPVFLLLLLNGVNNWRRTINPICLWDFEVIERTLDSANTSSLETERSEWMKRVSEWKEWEWARVRERDQLKIIATWV